MSRLAPLLVVVIFVSANVAAACGPKTRDHRDGPPPPPPPTGGERVPALHAGDAVYERFEGISYKNDCAADADCFTGGCAGEVCSAQNDIMSSCDIPPLKPADASCGCVAGQCIWWRAPGGGPVVIDSASGAGAAQGAECPDDKCAAGLTCITYYGVAGPRGPKFTSCEVPCAAKGATCPAGQSCTTIADGPGRVCR